MENLIAATEQFATAADYAQAHDVTKHQFEELFNVAHGFDDEHGDLAGLPKHVVDAVVILLKSGIACIDGLCLEHRCDAFDEWARNSLFFDMLKSN